MLVALLLEASYSHAKGLLHFFFHKEDAMQVIRHHLQGDHLYRDIPPSAEKKHYFLTKKITKTFAYFRNFLYLCNVLQNMSACI